MNRKTTVTNSIRRGVEEVDAKTKGFTNGGDGILLRNRAEDAAERRGTKADTAGFEAGVSQLPKLELGIRSRH